MAKKLTEDQIKWILSVESTEAQQEIRKLTKANRELEQANKDRRQEMIKVEMRGKKNSLQYKRLSAEVKENTVKLTENRAVIKGLEGTMKLTELTMGQLKKRAQELSRQLDNTSKSLHPEEYNKLEKELGDVRNRMTQLRDESKQVQQVTGRMIVSKGAMATMLGNIWTKVIGIAVQGLKKIKDFTTEGIRMAGMAQGIDFAFNRIANRDYLNSLREQTKGLVSDLTLMKSAVRAENFNIPLNQLGKLLEFAQNRARDTGESVDYLVESIINGIGRKSPLILDNLGISAVRLQEEVKRTGDFAGAVGKIIEDEMAKAGPVIDTATDAATRKKVAWENLQVTLGKVFVNLKGGWDNVVAGFATGLEKIISGGEKASKVYDDQIKKVADLEVNMLPLIDRYKVLKTNTNLSAKEQEELTGILKTVQSALPGVVTEVDKYGNAIAINTNKIYAFIAAEKLKLKYMNKEAVAEIDEELEKQTKKVRDLQNKINQGDRYYTDDSGRMRKVKGKYDENEVQEMKNQLTQEVAAMIDMQNTRKELLGSSLDDQVEVERRRVEMRNQFNGMNKKQLANWIADERNAKNQYLEIARETYNARFGDGGGAGPGGGSSSNTTTETPQWKKDLEALDLELAQKRLKLKEDRANEVINEVEHKKQLEQLEREYLFKKMDIANLDLQTQMQIQDKIFEYKIKMLEETKRMESTYFADQKKLVEKQNNERDKANMSLGKRLGKSTEDQLKEEYNRRAAANKQMVDLTASFSNEIGQLVGSAVSGNKDFVKDSIVSLINMGLDYLKIQTQLAVTGATLASLAQPDSVATFGASGFARALIMTGLIEAAFQAAKAVVGGIASKMGSSAGSSGSGSSGTTRVLSGREVGGFMDVERAQDGRRYRATYAPTRRGYVDRPTVIVGEGVDSREWIAPNDALENPTIAPFIDLLEQSRLRGDIRTIDLNQIMRARMAGFASGGYLSDNPLAEAARRNTGDSSLFIRKDGTISQADKSLVELNKTLKKLQSEGVSVNYQQFDKAKNRVEGIKSKASRK